MIKQHKCHPIHIQPFRSQKGCNTAISRLCFWGTAVNLGWLDSQLHGLIHTHSHVGSNFGLAASFINELCCAGRAAVMTMQNQDNMVCVHAHTRTCMSNYGVQSFVTPNASFSHTRNKPTYFLDLLSLYYIVFVECNYILWDKRIDIKFGVRVAYIIKPISIITLLTVLQYIMK